MKPMRETICSRCTHHRVCKHTVSVLDTLRKITEVAQQANVEVTFIADAECPWREVRVDEKV